MLPLEIAQYMTGWLIGMILINLAIFVLLMRWVFRVNTIVDLLQDISEKMDGLKPEIETRKRTPEEMRMIYGEDYNPN